MVVMYIVIDEDRTKTLAWDSRIYREYAVASIEFSSKYVVICYHSLEANVTLNTPS
jgi:hypothetical protein